jgi:hypothetical protein
MNCNRLCSINCGNTRQKFFYDSFLELRSLFTDKCKLLSVPFSFFSVFINIIRLVPQHGPWASTTDIKKSLSNSKSPISSSPLEDYFFSTLLFQHCTVSVLYCFSTVLFQYSSVSALLFQYYTVSALYRFSTIPFQYYTVSVLHRFSTTPFPYYTVSVLYRFGTLLFQYYTVSVLYCFSTLVTLQCKLSLGYSRPVKTGVCERIYKQHVHRCWLTHLQADDRTDIAVDR